MKLKQIGSNRTELYDTLTGASIFFSYETPVSAILPSGRAVKTKEYYSKTTSKHINKWLAPFNNVETVEQEFINNLFEGIK
mgnify:CR=1 FL=1|tara:strand:+ start:119 stop:361 length:243 start_codon:yes stop_codon:yes gene_type:complete